MIDDLLERSTRAYRDETAPTSDGADAVFGRIVRARKRRVGARRSVRVVPLSLGAVLLGSVAWAAATGKLASIVGGPPAPPPSQATAAQASEVSPTPDARSRRSEANEERAPVVAPEASASAGAPPSEDSTAAPLARQRARSSAGPDPASRAPDSSGSREARAGSVADVDSLYREAHRLHFTRRDYAAALVAWDRYLAAAGPSSRLLIEARYNRGIALARLGRRDEAITALSPFANAEYGQYRSDEARTVIESLKR